LLRHIEKTHPPFFSDFLRACTFSSGDGTEVRGLFGDLDDGLNVMCSGLGVWREKTAQILVSLGSLGVTVEA
jgi:hypothetical protein